MGACGSKSGADAFDPSSSAKRTASPNPMHTRDPPKRVKPDFGLVGHYETMRLLGTGGTGQTWLCKDVSNGEEVAIKFMRRPIPKPIVPMIMHEIKIQGDLGEGHLNIVSAKEVLLTHSHVALVMEYAAGGTMTSYVSDRWDTVKEREGLFLSEDEARYFMMQFLSAVEYCHLHQVAHRDLKLDNTLLDSSLPPRIKICDFGFAKNWDEQANMFTQIGTPVYMSPQLITSKGGKVGYDACKSDVWASGVLLFVMLLGMFPFEHSQHPDPNSSAAHVEVWMQQIKSSWQENPRVKEAGAHLSAECRDLLDKIFDLDEGSRLDIEGIKAHPWWALPLPPHLQAALDQLQGEQATINDSVKSGILKSADKDLALETLMTLAALPAKPTEPLSRISLTTLQPRYSLSDPAILASILEDASFHGAGRGGSWKGSLHGATNFSEGRTRTSDLVFAKDGGASPPPAAPALLEVASG